VQKIQTQGNSVKSIILDTGEEIEFDLVVSNIDAQLLYSKLIDHPLAKKALQRLTKSTPSLSGFVLLLAVEGKTPDIEHHNVWFPADYDAEFDQIFSKHPQPVTDPTIYACVPDDASMRPNANSESWFVLVNAPRHGVGPGLVDWNQPGMKENYAKNILSRLTDRGVNLEGRIKWQQIRTPRYIGAFNFTYFGSYFDLVRWIHSICSRHHVRSVESRLHSNCTGQRHE
jgi:phytoene dehydrogenase-like protein